MKFKIRKYMNILCDTEDKLENDNNYSKIINSIIVDSIKNPSLIDSCNQHETIGPKSYTNLENLCHVQDMKYTHTNNLNIELLNDIQNTATFVENLDTEFDFQDKTDAGFKQYTNIESFQDNIALPLTVENYNITNTDYNEICVGNNNIENCDGNSNSGQN
ncbi:uncharacterized protein LOC126910503 [Daktulosphaira vitifoliae]|uniref:uncharacterized protein LOC126910503 n=1 Tax=Daktulosphaira vitifoliae TaxID=58002 RepID=UPI0021AA8EA6|nr:uncharacterized protein LOC126910503 [Daktulosphaira vitifoliae]